MASARNVAPGKNVHILIAHDLLTTVHSLANPLNTAVQFAVIMIWLEVEMLSKPWRRLCPT